MPVPEARSPECPPGPLVCVVVEAIDEGVDAAVEDHRQVEDVLHRGWNLGRQYFNLFF